MTKFFSLSLSLENEEIVTELNPVIVTQEAQDADTYLNENAKDIEIATDAVEDAEMAIEHIFELASSLSLDKPITLSHAKTIDIAVESCLNSLGGKNDRMLTPALESRRYNSYNLDGNIALEGLIDKAKEIWKKTIKYIADIIKKVIDFIQNLFVNFDKLSKLIMTTRSKVLGTTNDKIKNKTFNSKTIASNLSDGKGLTNDQSLASILNAHISLSRNCKYVIDFNNEYMRITLEDVFEGKPFVKERFELTAKIIDLMTGANSSPETEKVNGDELKGMISKPLVGGKRIFVYVIEKEEKVEEETEKVYTYGFKVKKPDKSSKEAHTLTKGSCLEILNYLDKLVEESKNFKKVEKDLKKLIKASTDLVDAKLSILDKTGYKDSNDSDKNINKGELGEPRRMFVRVTNILSRWVTMIPAWNSKLVKTAVSYINESMDNWEKA